MALAPLSKSIPACEARPRTVIGIIAHALALGLEFSLKPGSRFQHKDGYALPGRRLREFTRPNAAHFLIGVELQDHMTPHGNVEFAYRAHGHQQESQATLHIEHARSPQPSFYTPEGHVRQRPQRPYCIGMAQREDLSSLLCSRQTEAAPQMAASELGSFARFANPCDEQLIEPRNRRGIVTRRFALH